MSGEEECKFATKFVWEKNQAGCLDYAMLCNPTWSWTCNPPALAFRLLGSQVHMYHTPSLSFSGAMSVTIRLSLASCSLDLPWWRATSALSLSSTEVTTAPVESGLGKTSKRKGKSIIHTHINLYHFLTRKKQRT